MTYQKLSDAWRSESAKPPEPRTDKKLWPDNRDVQGPHSPSLGGLGGLGGGRGLFSGPSFEVPYADILSALEARCPDCIEPRRWQQAIFDGQDFLFRWGEQAAALGWTARDLFGLHTPPAKPAPTYRRLSRYDETGLIWLLRGRAVVALTTHTAAIEKPSGAVTVYRRFLGDLK
jgi:hypothetical protein